MIRKNIYILSSTIEIMEIEKILVEMIKIDSARSDKTEIVSYIEKLFEDMGLKFKIYDSENPYILASHGKNGIVFSGHLDTVPIGKNWKFKQGSIKNGRIYGRGASDMKGGVVAILLAVENLLDEDVPFSIALTTDEETTMKGAEKLSKKIKGKYCIVCEPTDLKLSTQEKGVLQMLLKYFGKSCHSAMLWKGENAIYKSLETIKKIKSFKNDPEGITINLGRIKGGTKINVVPNFVELEIDIRFPSKYSFEDVINLFLFEADEKEVIHQLDPLSLDPPKELLQIVKETAISYFATEAIKFYKYMPTVILGPGNPFLAHQIDEYIQIGDVKKAAEIYEKFARIYP